MPTLSQVAAHTARVVVPWGETPIAVEYYPGKMTGNLIAQVEANADMDTISSILVDLLASWDLTEDDATMFPIDASRFGEIGLPVLVAVFWAMVKDMRPEAVAPTMTNGQH